MLDVLRWVGATAAELAPAFAGGDPVPLDPPGHARRTSGDPAEVWRVGGVVVKLHARRTDGEELALRLRVAAADPHWLGPLAGPVRAPDGRWASVWPAVPVLDPGAEPPWREIGAALAAWHLAPLPAEAAGLAHGWPRRLARVAEGAGSTVPEVVGHEARRAQAELAALAPDARPRTPVHGDLHLGQLSRPPGGAGPALLLLDPDDLGVGDPAWDLARFAGLWAAGLLDDDAWWDVLAGYRAAGGPAVPPLGDPWPALDLPARVAVLVAAAREAATPGSAALPVLLRACERMAS